MREKRPRRGWLRWFAGWRPYSITELNQSYRTLPKYVSLKSVRSGRHVHEPVRTKSDMSSQDVAQLECWLEVPLDDEKWVAAYRLVQEGGRPVVAELRVFPAESENASRPAGRWSGELFAIHARVPAGGLSATLLRQVRVGEHLEWGQQFQEEFYKTLGRNADRQFTALGIDDFKPVQDRTEPPSSRRGRPRENLNLARMAEAYVRSIERGSRQPIADVSRQMRLPETRVRSGIHRARKRGFLSKASKQGSRGGTLQAKAIAVLEEHRKKEARRGKKK